MTPLVGTRERSVHLPHCGAIVRCQNRKPTGAVRIMVRARVVPFVNGCSAGNGCGCGIETWATRGPLASAPKKHNANANRYRPNPVTRPICAKVILLMPRRSHFACSAYRLIFDHPWSSSVLTFLVDLAAPFFWHRQTQPKKIGQ